MDLRVRLDASGVERRFELLAESARQLDKPLKAFDRYLRARVKSRFERSGPNWDELAESTLERREQAALSALARRLSFEHGRAQKRYQSRYGALDDLGVAGDARLEKKRATLRRALARRAMTAAEFERARRRAENVSAAALERADAFTAPQAERQARSLRERALRAQARAGDKLLGRIAASFESVVRDGNLTLRSKVPWAGVHNEGGSVGHGATVPARPFLFLEERDVDVLVEILRDHMLVAVDGG